jgi:hypothetical protein
LRFETNPEPLDDIRSSFYSLGNAFQLTSADPQDKAKTIHIIDQFRNFRKFELFMAISIIMAD